MSFILDALKKLEQKKQQHSVPDLLTVHAAQDTEKNRYPVWPYIIAAALLINAVVLLAWLRPWEQDMQEPIQTMQTASTQAKQENITNHIPTPKATTAVEKPAASKTDTSEKPAATNTTAAVKEVKKAAEIQVPEIEEDPTEEVLTTRRLDMSTTELKDLKAQIKEEQIMPAPDPETFRDIPPENIITPLGALTDYGELPESIRKTLPPISINAHIYSNNPSSRLANINGELFREGDELSNSLIVEEITMDGIIFDYDGLRFTKNAF